MENSQDSNLTVPYQCHEPQHYAYTTITVMNNDHDGNADHDKKYFMGFPSEKYLFLAQRSFEMSGEHFCLFSPSVQKTW